MEPVESIGTPDVDFTLQLVKVTDGYGSPILFASVFVYILMRLLVKPFLVTYLASKGMDKAAREPWVLRVTLLPGLLSATIVDFSPIAKAVGVPLHWAAAIPVGAVFFAGGGVALHELLKRVDPIGMIATKLGGKTDRERMDEADEIYRETARKSAAITQAQVDRDKAERGL
jgi:hypothetical protein